MNTHSISETSAANSFANHTCYCCGDWCPYHQLVVSIDDIGFRQGVIGVERLRTYRQSPFQLAAHLRRWERTTSSLQIAGLPTSSEVAVLVDELLSRNDVLVQTEQDLGITLFATPGISGSPRGTCGLHLNRIDHQLVNRRRQTGQPIVVSDIQQPDSACWPRSIKVRSRIHYYLADHAARQFDPEAIGVLVDSSGQVTETSIASIAMVVGDRVISPPTDLVLPGITQSVIESIAAEQQIEWLKRAIMPMELQQADAILLMGTDAGIWPVSRINGHKLNVASDIYQQLALQFQRVTAGSEC